MAPLFFAIGVITAIWAAVRSEVAPQFQDELTSRYAFHVYALSPSTPLPLQTDYMKFLYCGCACPLCISLGLFSLGNVMLGGFVLIGFLLGAFSVFKSWKTYRANCVQPREKAEP